MNLETNMTMKVLKDSYGHWMNRERHATPISGASAFWHSLKSCFRKSEFSSSPSQGNDPHFLFRWMNDRLTAPFKGSSQDYLIKHEVLSQ